MSDAAVIWAWKQREGLSPAETLVLLALADRKNHAHVYCWPAIACLHSDTGLDRKTITGAVKRLEARGLIRRMLRRGVATKYQLIGAPVTQGGAPENPQSEAGDTLKTWPKNGPTSASATEPKNGPTSAGETRPKNGPPPDPKTGHDLAQKRVTNLKKEPIEEITASANAEESVASSNTTTAQGCPHVEIIGIYHEVLPTLQKVIPARWTGTRAKNLQARWREDAKHQDLKFWQWFFAQVAKSKFHVGENDRGWRADLGWLVERRNFDKMLERAVSARQQGEVRDAAR